MSDAKRVVALTGAGGFLGWHVKLALHASSTSFVEIPLGDRFDAQQAEAAISQSTDIIHLAGVNRGSDDEVSSGNLDFATQLSDALRSAKTPICSVTYANSTQSLNNSVYGNAKREASEMLAEVSHRNAITYRDLTLPNLFGEHGRPFYNSVVATFCHLLATNEGSPTVQEDRELTLLHAQDAADWLIGDVQTEEIENTRLRTATVSQILGQLQQMSESYSKHEMPDLSTDFARDLFNTYRSFVPVASIPLVEHSDARGSFVEMARSWGGTGQSSYSTTHPGISRGDHYHRRKVERFVVISGKAKLSLRRMFTNNVIDIFTDGKPVALDQPIGWTHNLTNIGDDTLVMFFWTNDIFNPQNPDTYMEAV